MLANSWRSRRTAKEEAPVGLVGHALNVLGQLHPVHHHEGSVQVHSKGGLGNQLFILGAGISLADSLDTTLEIDPFLHQYTDHLPFLLDVFLESAPVELQRSIRVVERKSGPVRDFLLKNSIPARCTFKEDGFTYQEHLWDTQAPACCSGYFQSWKYLRHLSEERRSQFRAALDALSVHQSASPSESDIILHVRRGDYTSPEVRAVHGLLPLAYYRDAAALLREHGATGSIHVISEFPISDISELQRMLGTPILESGSGNLWRDISFMMKSRYLAIANSTYSWWAAWLNDERATVIAPEPWFADGQFDTRDLIPEPWIKLGHTFS